MPVANTHVRRVNYTPQGQVWGSTAAPWRLWEHLAELQDTLKHQETEIAELKAMVAALQSRKKGE